MSVVSNYAHLFFCISGTKIAITHPGGYVKIFCNFDTPGLI